MSEGLSDHNLVYVVRKLYRPRIKPKVLTFRSFKRFDIGNFLQQLESSHLERQLEAQGVNEIWSLWKQEFMHICDTYAPVITMRVRGVKNTLGK